jgi:hypothetical protein
MIGGIIYERPEADDGIDTNQPQRAEPLRESGLPSLDYPATLA